MHEVRVLPRTVIAVVAVFVAVLAAGAVLVLLGWLDRVPLEGKDRATAQLDALKVGLSIGIGGGGVFALYLAARRQRSTELQVWQHERDLAQKDAAQRHVEKVAAANQAHQERDAAATEADAAERRVTELYAKAADQLGNDRTPVRMAGLYALERLAQANPDHRQTVVNVICAYLRMPYEPPEWETLLPSTSAGHGRRPSSGERRLPRPADVEAAPDVEVAAVVVPSEPEDTPVSGFHDDGRHEELQVRRAAADILVAHLQPYLGIQNNPDDPRFLFGEWHPANPPSNPKFWPDIDIDLSGATLIWSDFPSCRFRSANFSSVTHFLRSEFHALANFARARFDGIINFGAVHFHDAVTFSQARFDVQPNFGDVRFRAGVSLNATFEDEPFFTGALVWTDPKRRGLHDIMPHGWGIGDPISTGKEKPLSPTGQWHPIVKVEQELESSMFDRLIKKRTTGEDADENTAMN